MRRKCKGCSTRFVPRFDAHVWCSRACKTRWMKANKKARYVVMIDGFPCEVDLR